MRLRLGFRLLLASLTTLGGCDGCSKPTPSEPDASGGLPPLASDASPANGTIVPAASVEKYVNPQHLPVYTGETGSVEGFITVKGDPPPDVKNDYRLCPGGESTYGKAFRETTVDGKRFLADALVVATGYKNFYIPERSDAKELRIEGCSFAARTFSVTFGQRIEVKNVSKEFWSPMLEPAAKGMIMMATPGGDPVKLYPNKPGRYRVIDHDRHFAFVDVYALLQPLHGVSDKTGKFRIDGLPPGKLTINVAHPAMDGPSASKEVEIKANAAAKIDLELEYKAPPPPTPTPEIHVDGGLEPYPGQK